MRRKRLSLEQFLAFRQAAESMGGWLQSAMNPGLLTGQRRKDVTRMTFSAIRGGRLFVTQSKTGHKLAMPLKLKLERKVLGLSLAGIVGKCLRNNPSDSLIYSSVRRGGRKPGPVSPDALTAAFAEAREISGIKFGSNPPTFHEIRSLASRLYEVENGEDFAQRLLGQKTFQLRKSILIHAVRNR